SSRRRHTRCYRDWSSDVCSSDLTATFVTGGTAVDLKTIAPHEIRGTSIKDGETRQIVPGDVIIVPNGVPHWFKELPSPLDYFVRSEERRVGKECNYRWSL